jgi:hypothetical protein
MQKATRVSTVSSRGISMTLLPPLRRFVIPQVLPSNFLTSSPHLRYLELNASHLRARTTSSHFPRYVVLQQTTVGVSSPSSLLETKRTAHILLPPTQHTAVNQGGSTCYFGHVQGYLQGVVPAGDTICPEQYVPFVDIPGLFQGLLGGATRA